MKLIQALILVTPFTIATAQTAGSDSARVLSEGIGSSGDLHLELREIPGAGQLELVASDLRQTHQGLQQGDSNRLFQGGDHLTYDSELRFASMPSDEWLAAGVLNPGGARWVVLWTGVSDPLSELRGHDVPATRYRVRSVELLNVSLDERESGPVARDLADVDVFSWRGRFYVLGTGHHGPRKASMGHERVWLAEFPNRWDEPAIRRLRDGRLLGLVAADGVDPQVVVRDEDVLLGVRVRDRDSMRQLAFRLAVYRSENLVDWELVPALSGVSVRDGYSLYGRGNELWLATPVEDVEHGGALASVLRFDPALEEWTPHRTPHPEHLALSSLDGPVWLTHSKAGAPALIARDVTGRLSKRTP